MSIHYPFPLMPLPYPANALEPFIDKETVLIHHGKHLKKYVDTLNKTLEPYPKYHLWSLEKFLKNIRALPQQIQIDVKNNAGGVFNHNLYFCSMGKYNDNPTGALAKDIITQFVNYDNFKEKLKEAALSQFGSGYAWLSLNKYGKLSIDKTLNQDTVFAKGLNPILVVDVWEHAYYLKYQNRRSDYIDNWFKIINWEAVGGNYIRIKEFYNNNTKNKHNMFR